MANLLYRLLRGKPAPEVPRDAPAPRRARKQIEVPPARLAPPDFEAKPTPVRGRRKTREETASIGPGEPS